MASNNTSQVLVLICSIGILYAEQHSHFKGNRYSEVKDSEKAKVSVYYETLCPYCMDFLVDELAPAVNKLADFMDIKLFPYGNAKTKVHDDGTFDIKCQHGPKECYGNQINACAIEKLQNITAATLFNACTMDQYKKEGDFDKAADKCGELMVVDVKPIKACAGSDEGKKLHKQYGDESTFLHYVPYETINDKTVNADFWKELCSSFGNPPPACKN